MSKQKQVYLDNIHFKKRQKASMDLAAVKLHLREKVQQKKSTLFSRGKISHHFFTEDSGLYVTPKEQELLEKGVEIARNAKKWDAINSRVVRNYRQYRTNQKDFLFSALEKRYAKLNEELKDASQHFLNQFSMAKLWNMSIVGAILVGMFSMSLIYRYLGQGAAAGVVVQNNEGQTGTELVLTQQETTKIDDLSLNKSEVPQLTAENLAQDDFEKRARQLVKGYPIEKMLPYILEKDRETAAFLIAIAKKESAWGVHVPLLNGQDCYNYWGYRGQRKLMGTGGHTCFNSRKDAVDTVAKRIDNLVNGQKLNTAAKLIVWKCGSTCAGHGNYDVQKWISDVDTYYQKLNKRKEF